MTLLFIFTIILSYGDLLCAGEKVYAIPFNNSGRYDLGAQISFEIGTPPQRFYGLMIPRLTDIYVVDSECGQRSKDCPMYCDSALTSPIYCPPQCQLVDDRSRPAYCINKNNANSVAYYSRKNSTTYKDLKLPMWQNWLAESRTLKGLHVQDTIKFTTTNGVLELKDMVFKSGLLLDQYLFWVSNSLIGFAPGSLTNSSNYSFFYRLYKDGVIERPIISIYGHNRREQTLLLGKQEMDACKNWQYFETAEENAWASDVDEIEVMGVKLKGGKTRLFWDNSSGSSKFPREGNQLLVEKAGYIDDGRGYIAWCPIQNATIKIKFSDGQKLTIKQKDLAAISDWEGFCSARIEDAKPTQFTTDSAIALGDLFLGRRCQMYDFEKRRIGIADVHRYEFTTTNPKEHQ